jgi:hypothetical protein
MLLTSLTAGLVLIVFGALIWRFKFVGLIAGRRPGYVTDKEGLARWLGKNMIGMGALVLASAVIQFLLFQNTHLAVDLAIILVLSTRMALGTAKFSKPLAKAHKKAGSKAKKKARK